MSHHGRMTERVRSELVRPGDPDRDAEAVAAIYRPAVEGSVATFEEIPPGADEMARRMRAIMLRTPWLVAEDGPGGKVIGYAYAGRHRERAGYRWSVDISAYIHPDHRGRGIGRLLYDALLPLLRRQGFVNVYAGIAIPNVPSVSLHEHVGMRWIGVYEHVGFKFGAWHDVAWYGLRLVDLPDSPVEPVPYPELPELPAQDGS